MTRIYMQKGENVQSKTRTCTSSSDVMKIANEMIAACRGNTMEAELLRKKCTRALYKALGDPMPADFPDAFKHASEYTKQPGYTNGMVVLTEGFMKAENNAPTDWHIERASYRKVQIVEEYTRDGWHATVYAYTVLCRKYIKHPRYPNIWVYFYVSRDCARYEYVLEKHHEEND